MAMALDSLEELDRLASLQRDDRLLPVGAAADEATDPLLLAAHRLRPHVDHVDVEQLLDGVADLDLVGVTRHLEEDLLLELLVRLRLDVPAAGLAEAGPLLREEGALDNGLGCPHLPTPPPSSSARGRRRSSSPRAR